MVDATNGAVLWENSAVTNNTKVTFDAKEAGDELTKGLAEQWVEKIFKTPLEEEAKLTVQKALQSLPGFVFCGFEHTPLKSDPVKTAIQNNINKK